MCGRMTLTRGELAEVADELQAELDVAASWKARYNVAPTDLHPVLHTDGDRRLLSLWRWGFPGDPPAPGERKRGPLVNARSETARFRPTFRDSWRTRRCVIPADGFFEWRKTQEGRRPLW